MNKKKIAFLLVAAVLTVSVVGGTLAWFTSSDSVTNIFSTAGGKDGNTSENSGIKIQENFDKDKASKVIPGTEVNKEVQVHSDVNYAQFVRVKITPQFTDAKGNIINENLGKTLNTDMIQLNFTGNLKTDKSLGSWYKDAQDGQYYYMGKLGAGSYTNTLLKSVMLNPLAGNEYKNLKFDVVVNADSIQASNDAYKDWTSKNLQDTFSKLQNGNIIKPTDKIIEG